MFRRKDKPVPESTEPPTEATAPEVNAADLEKRVAALEKALGETNTTLTGRVNDVTKKVAENNAALIKRVGSAEADLTTVKTSADNNAEAIKAFNKRLDGLVHKAEEAEAATKVLTTRLDNTEAWQSAFNTAFIDGIQSAKDFALEQGQAAKKYTDGVATQIRTQVAESKAALQARIKAVEDAPVKAHSHRVSISVDAETGGPQEGNG